MCLKWYYHFLICDHIIYHSLLECNLAETSGQLCDDDEIDEAYSAVNEKCPDCVWEIEKEREGREDEEARSLESAKKCEERYRMHGESWTVKGEVRNRGK